MMFIANLEAASGDKAHRYGHDHYNEGEASQANGRQEEDSGARDGLIIVAVSLRRCHWYL